MNKDYEQLLKEKFDNNPSNVIKKWDVFGTEKLENKIKNAKQNQWEDIVNRIVLWKVNRQVDISEKLIDRIVNFNCNFKWNEETDYSELNVLLKEMLQCRGIRLPMASTILHFIHPNTFLIIDRRAYRVVFDGEEFKDSNNNEKMTKVYINYMIECDNYYNKHNLKKWNIPFSHLDRYTYQLDIEAGNKVNEE